MLAAAPDNGATTIRPRVFILILLTTAASLLAGHARAQVPGQHKTRTNPTESLEDETQRRLVEQPAGINTLKEHNLPSEFVRRVADRIIRMQVQQQLRSVERPNAAATDSGEPQMQTAMNESGHAGSSPIGIIVIAFVFVAIVAVSHRKPATGAKNSSRGRHK